MGVDGEHDPQHIISTKRFQRVASSFESSLSPFLPVATAFSKANLDVMPSRSSDHDVGRSDIEVNGLSEPHKDQVSRSTTVEVSEPEDGALSMGRGRHFPSVAALGDRSAHVVDFDGPRDPLHPHNWPSRKK